MVFIGLPVVAIDSANSAITFGGASAVVLGVVLVASGYFAHLLEDIRDAVQEEGS